MLWICFWSYLSTAFALNLVISFLWNAAKPEINFRQSFCLPANLWLEYENRVYPMQFIPKVESVIKQLLWHYRSLTCTTVCIILNFRLKMYVYIQRFINSTVFDQNEHCALIGDTNLTASNTQVYTNPGSSLRQYCGQGGKT